LHRIHFLAQSSSFIWLFLEENCHQLQGATQDSHIPQECFSSCS
jgi:hypothetical protein